MMSQPHRDTLLVRLVGAFSPLVLVLALLLFAQWPLRDWVQAGSRLANDLGQIVFALYIAAAVGAASLAGTHLAAGHGMRSLQPWRAWAVLACVGPWAAWMSWAQWPALRGSVLTAERFAETLDPGYFMIRVALALMLALIVAVSVSAVWRRMRAG